MAGPTVCGLLSQINSCCKAAMGRWDGSRCVCGPQWVLKCRWEISGGLEENFVFAGVRDLQVQC